MSLLLCLGLLTLSAAPGQDGESPEKSAVVRFTVWGEWGGNDLYIKRPGSSSKPDDGFLKVDLLDLGYSASMPFRRAEPIQLCTPIEKEGETIWQPLVTVSIPAEIREPLVMIFPGENGAVRCKVFDLHPSAFPYGDYQLVNLSKRSLLAKLDETVLTLRPGAGGQFKGAGKTSLNVWLRVAAEREDKTGQIVYSSMMRNRRDKRMFMVFHSTDSIQDAPVSVRTLVDFAPPVTPP